MHNFIKAKFAALRRALKSWTINWGLVLLQLGYFHENIGQVLPFINRYIPSEDTGVLVMLIGLVVIGLRFKTSKPIGER